MTDFIVKALAEKKLGLALHYPIIHTAVTGLDALKTLEFGAGGSTRVFIDAHLGAHQDGKWDHWSISTDSKDTVRERYDIPNVPRWRHFHGLSQELIDVDGYSKDAIFDIVLHDGSHAASVVENDISWVWSKIKRFGLLFVHDTQHSYCGIEMREGLRRGLERAEARCSVTTLSYGYGLTIIRKEENPDSDVQVRPVLPKKDSPHSTTLVTLSAQVFTRRR